MMRSTAAADAQQRALQTLMEGYVKGEEEEGDSYTYIYAYIHTYIHRVMKKYLDIHC